MKKKILLAVLAIALIFNISGQERDSISLAFKQYNYQEALRLINKQENAMDVEMLYLKAQAYKGLNKFQNALDIYLQVYKQDSSNISVLVDIAESYKFLGNNPKALEYYMGFYKQDSTNQYIKLQIADCLFNMDKYEYAVNYYHELLEQDTTHYLARQLAKSYYNNEIENSAIQYYEIAVNLNHADKHSVYRLGSLCLKKEKYSLGIKATNAYIEIDSTNNKINILNGILLYKNREYQLAIDRFNKCLAQGDSSMTVFRYLGLSYFKDMDYYLAIPALEPVLLDDTMDFEMYYVMAKCYHNINNPKSIEYYHKLLDILTPAPTQLSAIYLEMYDAYKFLGNKQAAIGSLHNAIEMDSENIVLLNEIASYYLYTLEEKDSAYFYYNKIVELTQDSLGNCNTENPGVTMLRQYANRQIERMDEEKFWVRPGNDTIN